MPVGPWLGPLISGLFGFGASALDEGPQEKKSFAGTSVDPKQLLAELMKNVNGIGGVAADKLSQGTKLRAVAPTPPGFKVQDPALIDPSLLDYKGPDLSGAGNLFQRPAPGPVTPLTAEERRNKRGGRRQGQIDESGIF
jgi:hypothetical protein